MSDDDTPPIWMALLFILLLTSPILLGLWLSTPDEYPTVNVNHTCQENA